MPYSEFTLETACQCFEDTIFIDRPEYYLDQLDRVLGILSHCVGEDPAMAGAAP
jgi:hypothetical protein